MTLKLLQPEDIPAVAALETQCFHTPWSAAALAYLYLNADGESADVEEIAGEFSCPVRQVKRAVALLSRSLDEVNETGIQE